MITWYSATTPAETDRLVKAWSDAPFQNEELCNLILDTAREQVLSYAPEQDEEAEVPSRFVYAQLQQARNLWNAGRTTGEGDVGPEGFVFRPYPLDNTIKQIIRPVDGKPHVL